MAEATANLRLGLVDDGLVKGVSNISTQLTNLQLASAAVSAALPLLEKGLKSSASQYLVGAKNAKLLANNLGDLIEYNKQLGNALGKASNVAFYTQQLATLAKGAVDAYRSLKRIPETLEQMERSGISTESIQGFMQLRDAIGGSQAAVESFAQVAVAKLNAVEQASARVGTILKSSTEFNEQGVAKRANAEDLSQNRKQIQQILRDRLDNTVTTTEALLGQYEVLSGGFTSATASQQVLDPGLKLIGIAGAGGQAVDPTATLQLLTKTLRAYGLEASQATRVSAILNGTVENGITTIQELSLTFGQASQVAKTAGIAIEDLAAATAVLTAQGTSTPVALTGIQALARTIIDKTPEAAKELAKLRDSQGNRIRLDIREVQQKGLVQAIQDLFQATGGNQELLAKILPDSLAYRTALGLNSNKGQDFANVAASIRANANGQALDEVFNTATGDRISRFEKIANRFEETIIQLGESLAPVFEPGIAYLERFSKLIASIPDPIKKAIGSYLSFQIQSKAVGIAFGQLSGAVVSVLSNFALLRVINLILTGQFGKQVAIIKELILQKKGLGAAIKQIIGLDQSHLLSTEAATNAIAKEGIVQKTVNAVKEKANEVIKKNVQGYNAQTAAASKAGQAVGGVKSRFVEFVNSIKNTTVGQKIEEITSKFTAQREAIKDLAKEAQEYVGGIKETPNQRGTQVNNQLNRPIDRQIEAYRQKRLAELATATESAYDTQSLESLFDSDPSIQKEREKRKQLEKDSQRKYEQEADDLLKEIKGKNFGQFEGVSSFGEFALQERLDRLNTGIEDRKSNADILNVADETFGDSIASERKRLREKSRSRGFGDLNKTRQLYEAGELAGKATTKINLLEASVNGLGAAFGAVGTGAKQGLGFLKGLAAEAIVALGPIVPIGLAIGAAFALAGKEINHLFGGGAANELSRGLQGTLDKLKELEKESGKDGALLSFKGELESLTTSDNVSVDSLKPLESRLTKLRDEGALTSGQFASMGEAFRKAGEDGKITAQELSVLQNQVESFRAGAPGKIEEGVIDKIKSTLSLEGLGRLTNFIGNTAGAAIKNILNPFGEFTTAEDINAEREADKLIKPLSEMRLVLDEVGDSSVASAEKTKQLTQGIFLTQEARDLAAKGSQIQGIALAKESKAVEEQIKRNDLLISSYQEQAETRRKLLEETTDPKLKQQLQDQFDAAQLQVDSLQKRTEALKQAQEQVLKYYNEVLPALQQAVINSAVNPVEAQGALDDALEVYRNKYLDEGKVFLKDVQQQRTEGQAVIDQVLQNYDRNLLGTADAANKIKEVLQQSYITVKKDGRDIRGSIFDIDTQKNLISQIAQFNAQATTERLAQIDIESAAITAAGQQRKASEESVIKQTTQLQREKLTLQKQQLEEEIQLRSQYGIKTTDLENKLKQLNLEIAQSEFDEREKLAQKRLQLQLQIIEVQRSNISALTAERGLSEENTQKKIAQLQIQESQLRANELKRQLDEYTKNGVKNVELENQYAQARNQIRELEAKEKERLIQQELQQRTQAFEIEKNQAQVLAEEGKLGEEKLAEITAKTSIEQAQLKEQDLARQVRQLRANGQISVSLEQEYAQQRLQVRSLEARERKRLIEQQLQQQATALETEKTQLEALSAEGKLGAEAVQRESAQIAIAQAKLREQDLARQINELKAAGSSSVALEQQYAQQRLQTRILEGQERKRLIEEVLQQQIKALDIEKSKLEVLSEEGKVGQEDLARQTAQLSIEQARLREQDLARQLNELRANGQSSVALEQEYAQQRLQLRSLEARERKRLIEEALQQQLKALDIEQAEIEARISERSLSEREGQEVIAQNRIQQERLRLAELDRQLQVLKSSGSQSVALEQEAASARIRIRKLEADERNRLEDLQLDTFKKQLENENQRASLRQQTLEAEYDILQKQSQLVESITNSRNQLADTESRYVQNQLQNQAKLNRDSLQQAEIELRILGERKVDLARTQKAELESLAIRQKLATIDLQRQKSQLLAQQLELDSQSQILAIELKRAENQKRSPEEIEAIKLQIQANQQRRNSLNEQLKITDQQVRQQNEINRNEQKRINLTQQIELENIKTEETLTRQKVLQEQIDRVVKNFALTQQKIQQQYEKQTSALENQSTILGAQKQLIEARQKAFDDSLSLTNSELDLASRLANSDRERNALAQTTASVKLRALEEQQKAEREVLLINQQQAKVQQEIEAIRLRGQQAQNLADVAQAQADLAKLQVSGATPQEILAAQLNIQAKQQAGQALATQSALLPLQQQLLDFTQQQELSNLDRKQRLDRFNAQADVASNLGLIERTQLNQQIQNELLSSVFGQAVNPQNSGDFFKSLMAGNRLDLQQLTGIGSGLLFPTASYSRGLVPTLQSPVLNIPNLADIQAPDIQLKYPTAPDPGQTQSNQTQPNQPVQNNVTLEVGGITITASGSGEVAKGLEQEVLNAFDKIMIETKRRLGS